MAQKIVAHVTIAHNKEFHAFSVYAILVRYP